ncbi:MAG TPA: hypothetical protein VGS04_04195 [Nitrososphaerales archaeon]|nr:hypothetical protein [Nitrososphaerales archaeon]
MDPSTGSFLNPLVDLVALGIIALGIYRLKGQQIPPYLDAKVLLLVTDVVFAFVVVMELVRNLDPTELFMAFYGTTLPILIFTDAVLLTSFAYVVYTRPTETRFSDRVRAFLTKRAFPHGVAIIGLSIYVLFLDVYLVVSMPFSLASLRNLGGAATVGPVYTVGGLELSIPVVLLYLVYPTTMLLLAARRISDKGARRGIVLITLGWLAVGPAIFLNALFAAEGYDVAAIGFLIVSIAFIPHSTVFRGSSGLAGFFGPMSKTMPEAHPFTNRLGGGDVSLQGSSVLMQYEPTARFEEAVRDFVIEEISGGTPTYIFTSRGSPIHTILSSVPAPRFFLMTESVSYPKTGESPYEILIPRNDQAVTLDVLERAIKSDPTSSIALVFDSVSDLILYDGVERTYKFLKQVNELLGESGVTALFLMTSATIEERSRKLVMSVFQRHLQLDDSGMRVTR